MNHLEVASNVAAECATAPLSCSAQPCFTRAQFSSDGRVHTESRCRRCGFRITAASSASFDDEENQHARDCSGTQAE